VSAGLWLAHIPVRLGENELDTACPKFSFSSRFFNVNPDFKPVTGCYPFESEAAIAVFHSMPNDRE
jgi:hypothetical protein